MDSRTGLDYIVENRDYVAKLGAALDTSNHTVKKQVFELLAALCAYSAEGYNRALETLEHYMNLKSERYRLKLVVTELDTAPAIDYQIALLAFVNCLIISAPTLPKRIKIRNELIGLNLLPVINNMRKSAQNVADIKIQLDVFDEQRESDEAQSLQDPDGINLNSHLDVFYAILRQVADTPQGIPFLSILQHLLRIDPKEAISDLIWDTAETLVHRATLLENREDSVRLLRAPSVQKFTCPHCRGDISAAAGGRKQSLAGGPLTPSTPGPLSPIPIPPPNAFSSSTTPSLVPPAPAPPPPPPPAPPGGPGPAIPPPPPPMMAANIPPPPPPLSAPNPKKLLTTPQNNQMRPKTPEPPTAEADDLLPQQETPVPKSKMKTINWNKIPSNKVMGHNNIWTMVATSQNSDKIKSSLDWEEIEGLFCQQLTTSVQGSPKLGRERTSDGTGTLERKKKDNEINLLDGKRSLNVNIFLKQFRSSNEDIIQLIKNGEHDDIGAEKLRGLLKILPEVDELDMLKSFDGDKSRLGNAEKFLLDLMKLSNYKLRIECMLLKEEFAVNMGYLEPAIRAMLYAGEDLMTNKALQEVLYMVLVTGNFLNSGGYAGNAAGVKLSSLQKLTDIRANKPGMNLIHFVALQAEKTNPELLKFPEQLTTLENASKTSVEQLNNELTTLDGRIRKIKKQIESPQTDSDIKEQMMEFLQISEREVAILQNYMKELTNLRVKLAEFFVEDVNAFKMEECYKIFQNFRERFKQALLENERRRYQEEQASIRRKQREDQLAAKRRTMNLQLESNSSMDSNYILDPLQFPVSPALSRRRMGSFNTHSELGSPRDMGPSPEGSLRRRKSRNLNEDETLMDFLRQSGHDNASRERKSYGGSLDRSWARRNRDAGFRKRPDLFNVDFNADRERGHSPSPQIEVKELPGGAAAIDDPSKQPRISKEWHQKIQSWLQHNDDGKRPVDFKKTRVSNRRSYDEDSESDRSKLDPLPEEPTKKSPSKWQPSNTLEGTDIVGAIEAIQEAQPKVSGWTDGNRLRRQLSKEKCSSPQLESIKEENKRKLVIQELGRSGADENIDIYFRRPIDIKKDKSDHRISTSADNTQNIYVNATDSGPHSITSSFRQSQRRDKIEIDSDNIETPPVTRKSMTTSDNVDSNAADNDGEILGNGQFDRHSSARKTRRYKRPTLSNGGSDDQLPNTPEPGEKEKSSTKVYLEPKSPPVVIEPSNLTSNEDKDSRLKRWQERLKSLDKHDSLLDSPTPTNTTSRSSSRKNISASLNPEEVKDAVHYLQRQNSKSNKIINMELNDEGFEESQSLVSDTPSQGKDNHSGTETAEGKSTDKVKRMNSSESTITSTSTESKTKPTPAARSITPSSSSLARRTQSLRSGTPSTGSTTPSRPNLPVRSNSALRKNDSGSSIASQSKRNPVQKSNSRNSLLSSRSSLNSAVSTNTVKRAPLPSGSSSTATKSSLLDKKSPSSSLTSRLSSNGTKIPGSTSTTSSKSSSPSTTATLSSMRSGGNLTSASAAAQQLRDQLKRPTGIAPSSSTSSATHASSSLFGTKDSVNNRLNLSTSNNYPLRGSSSAGGGSGLANSSTNSINSYMSSPKVATNSTNSTISSNSPARTGSTSLTRKGSAGSNFMRPTASSVTKASAIGTPSVAAKPSRFR